MEKLFIFYNLHSGDVLGLPTSSVIKKKRINLENLLTHT